MTETEQQIQDMRDMLDEIHNAIHGRVDYLSSDLAMEELKAVVGMVIDIMHADIIPLAKAMGILEIQ